jgi:hypothetical protein
VDYEVGGDCWRGKPVHSAYTQGDDDKDAGDYSCYLYQGDASMERTHQPTLVYAYAASRQQHQGAVRLVDGRARADRGSDEGL